ncbi:PTS sugar transporter subunit IIA [Longibaculum muris]|uniref:PTS sugar transporter subunit IIA n=1 Tax=Longibaculum muris TaxID=1796628 RepID=UPI003AB809CF
MFLKKNTIIHAICDGKIVYLDDIDDYAFSHYLIGDGIITTIAQSGHAFTMQLKNGIELLIHIGINHQHHSSEYFHYHIQVGEQVTSQTLILTLDKNYISLHNHEILIPIIVLNSQEHPIKTMTTSPKVTLGQKILTLK